MPKKTERERERGKKDATAFECLNEKSAELMFVDVVFPAVLNIPSLLVYTDFWLGSFHIVNLSKQRDKDHSGFDVFLYVCTYTFSYAQRKKSFTRFGGFRTFCWQNER